EVDVRIRDDRGTPRLPADDMNIGPLTYVEFDEVTQRITTESHVDIQDPDTLASGDGMLIQLRRKDPNAPAGQSSSGFNGAETAYLLKNAHVVMRDVGQSGVLPGSAPPRPAAAKTGEPPARVGG